ncbi:magnesium transporter [Candidatus Marinamargulisbacteria bacterium SCGC AG-410-N11]|nr:magnesium transporter [Candidatus Marinamargulisbacteria bacterium SCGC AG-410-N11]
MKSSEKNSILYNKILKAINSKSKLNYSRLFNRFHDADISEALLQLNTEQRLTFFRKFKPELAVDVLEEMQLQEQVSLISELRTALAADYIEEMEPDDAVDLIEELQEINANKAQEILDALPDKEAEDLQHLLSYEENSAGAIMTTEFICIPENLTIKQALSHIKRQNPPDSEISFYIFIVSDKNKLLGYISLRNLLMNKPSDLVETFSLPFPVKITIDTDQEDAAKIFQKYDFVAIPVVDKSNTLVGLITIDDIVDVVVEEANEDIIKLSGTYEIEEEKLISGSIFYSIFYRIPWLLLTISGGLFASFIINYYSNIHPSINILPLSLCLSFIPIIMGLGGNVGNQSATIFVRGISTGLIKDKKGLFYILREFCIGIFIGSIISFIVFIFNYFFSGLPTIFSIIVFISIVTNIIIATLIGSSLPILLRKINIDPAIASAPLISTSLDLLGQVIYFSVTFFSLLYFL